MEEFNVLMGSLTQNSDIGDIAVFVLIAWSLFKGHVIPKATHEKEMAMSHTIAIEASKATGEAMGAVIGDKIALTISNNIEEMIDKKFRERDSRKGNGRL